jgi:hypothetical protein
LVITFRGLGITAYFLQKQVQEDRLSDRKLGNQHKAGICERNESSGWQHVSGECRIHQNAELLPGLPVDIFIFIYFV